MKGTRLACAQWYDDEEFSDPSILNERGRQMGTLLKLCTKWIYSATLTFFLSSVCLFLGVSS